MNSGSFEAHKKNSPRSANVPNLTQNGFRTLNMPSSASWLNLELNCVQVGSTLNQTKSIHIWTGSRSVHFWTGSALNLKRFRIEPTHLLRLSSNERDNFSSSIDNSKTRQKGESRVEVRSEPRTARSQWRSIWQWLEKGKVKPRHWMKMKQWVANFEEA